MLTFALFVAVLALVVLHERRWRMAKRLVEDLRTAVQNDGDLLLDADRNLAAKIGLDRLLPVIREKMEERIRVLARSESQMEQIETTFRNMREGAMVLDPENQILVSNVAAERLLNEGRSLVGRRIERFIHHPGFLDFIRDVKESGVYGRRQIEVDLLGKAAWLEISGAPLDTEPEGGSGGLSLFLVNDITRLKRLEAIRRDFAANVSHELRTPITVIKGFAETLHDDGARLTPAEREQFVEKIHRNAGRLHTLVEDLLALSRLESRALEVKREPRCLQEEIRAFAAEYRIPAGRTADLRLELPEEPLRAAIDPVYLHRVLTNLVDNAYKHGETNTFVEVFLRRDEENGLIEMGVVDDGVGIPERVRDRVFQRFYRLDKGRSSRTGGTGLGLSIVRHAMLSHGGNVRVLAREPTGSRFVCVFPELDEAKEPA